MQGAYQQPYFNPNMANYGVFNPQLSMLNSHSDPSMLQQFAIYEPQRQMPQMPSGYSSGYQNIQEILYFEPGDGEIFVYFDTIAKISKCVTCIDISTLFKEKRAKAINITNFLAQVRHQNIVQIYAHQIIDEKYIFIEMEAPQNTSLWKTFCKKKFQPDEVLHIIRQIGAGLEFLHSLSFTHRDMHPSRFQQFPGNVIKFNPIGLPYNFKKLLKRDNFSGHINYSAPELILEKALFTSKVDVWSLGCSLYYLVIKKDPFDGPDPNEIKRNILSLTLDVNQYMMIPVILKPILEACFIIDENIRPTSAQLMQLLNSMPSSFRHQSPLTSILPMQMNQMQQHHTQYSSQMNPQSLRQPQNFQTFSPSPSQSHSQSTSESNSPVKFDPSKIQEFKPSVLAQRFEAQLRLENSGQKTSHCGNQIIERPHSQPLKQFQTGTTSTQASTLDSEIFIKEPRSSHIYNESKESKAMNNQSYHSDDFNREALAYTPEGKKASLNDSISSRGGSVKSLNLYQEIKVIFHDEDGNIYEGEMYNNKKHGIGKQLFPNGSLYEGQWKEGFMDGQGKFVLSTGEIYIGQFKRGKRHGQGKLIFAASGDIYEGNWYCDKMQGKGRYIYANGKIFEGDYVEGAPYGYGILSCKQFFYEGFFKSGLFEGHGKLQDFVNNEIFEGEYYDGKRRGFGRTFDLKTGEIFEGNWKEDKREGPGKLVDQKHGFTIESVWQNNEIKNHCTVNSDLIELENYLDDEFGNQQILKQPRQIDLDVE